MKAGTSSLTRSDSDKCAMLVALKSPEEKRTSERIAGAFECSLEVTGWMALAGVVVAIFTLRFALIFFVAVLLVIFRGR